MAGVESLVRRLAIRYENDASLLLGIQVSTGPYLLEVLARRGGFVDRWAEEATRLAIREQAGRA